MGGDIVAYKDILSKLNIYSMRDDKPYSIVGFREYSIDSDMETDSDQFNIIIENPGGRYTGIFNKYDGVALYVMDMGVMHGRVDDVTYMADESQSIIQIVGRDDMSLLIDNDAIPTTLSNVDPVDHLRKKCMEFGMSTPDGVTPRVRTYGDIPRVEKVVIGTGESEMTVLNNLVVDSNNRIWQDGEWLCIGKWNTDAIPEYYFTRGVTPDKQGIPIKSIRIRDSAIGLKSECLIYGTMDDGKDKVLGTARNPGGGFYDGKSRRMVMSSHNNDKSTKYSGSAERKVRDAFRQGIQIEIKINPMRMIKPIWINKTARIVDVDLKLDATFFIKAVNYTKSITSGSSCTITMVPSDSTCDILWQNIGPSRSSSGYLQGKSEYKWVFGRKVEI